MPGSSPGMTGREAPPLVLDDSLRYDLPTPFFTGSAPAARSLRERLEPHARAVVGRDRAAFHVEAVIVELLPLLPLRLRSRPPEVGVELVAARHPALVLALELGIVGQRAQLGRHAFHV